MIDNLKILATYLVLTGGLIAGNWYGVKELLRISIWGTWALSVVCAFVAVCLPGDAFFKNDKTAKSRTLVRFLLVIHLVLLIAAGWMFTAAIYALCWFTMWLKRSLWLEKQKKASAEA